MNKAAREYGWDDYGKYEWTMDYSISNMTEKLLQLWEQIKPLYLQLHAYVRHKLRALYPNIFRPSDPIPAHLLGILLEIFRVFYTAFLI